MRVLGPVWPPKKPLRPCVPKVCSHLACWACLGPPTDLGGPAFPRCVLGQCLAEFPRCVLSLCVAVPKVCSQLVCWARFGLQKPVADRGGPVFPKCVLSLCVGLGLASKRPLRPCVPKVCSQLVCAQKVFAALCSQSVFSACVLGPVWPPTSFCGPVFPKCVLSLCVALRPCDPKLCSQLVWLARLGLKTAFAAL